VSGWPSWIIPGKSRIFLAHCDDNVSTDKGSIFGYFTFYGADIIFSQEDCEKLKDFIREYHNSPNEHKDPEQLMNFLWAKYL
jgi:hypothetical protein